MQKKRGQALVEYVLIIALIVVVIFSIMSFLSGYMHDIATKISCDITYRIYVDGDKPGEGKCLTASEYEKLQKEEITENEEE